MFSHSLGYLLFCWRFSFTGQNNLFWYSSICLFFFLFPYLNIYITKILLKEITEILLPIFSSNNFMFKSLINSEFILVHDVRSCLVSFFAHIFPIFQHHLLNRLSLPHHIFLLFLSNINWPYRHGFIYGLCIPFHWSICLFSCQYMLFSLL